MIVRGINLSKLCKNNILFLVLRKWDKFVILLSLLNGYPSSILLKSAKIISAHFDCSLR